MEMDETPGPSPLNTFHGSSPNLSQDDVTRQTKPSRIARQLSWATKGGLALTDQGLYAGAQLALNILLARQLSPAAYGAFAVAYSVFVLASGIHGAILLEPMIIFGSGRYLKFRKSYLAIVLRGHWLLTVSAGLVLMGVGFLIARTNSQSVGYALCALGAALPFMLLVWLTRRAFYIELRPGRAATGGAIYFCSLMVLIWRLDAMRLLTPATAIGGMGAAALLTGSLQLIWLDLRHSPTLQQLTYRGIASEHWGYGRWAVASGLVMWAPLNVYYWVLPAWFGLKAAGGLKALMNLASPASHSLLAFVSLVLPLLVRHRDRGGLRLMRQSVRRVASLFFVGAAVYFVVLWFFRVPIIHLLYGGKYLEYSGLPVLLVGLVPLATAGVVTFGAALRACERPDRVFWGYLAGSLLTVSLGVWLAATLGLVGALAGYIAAYGVVAGVFCYFYRKLDWHRAVQEDAI